MVAVRSEPPRPRVVTLPSGARPMKPGHHGREAAAQQGLEALARALAGEREVGGRGAVPAVGGHELRGVDLLGPPARGRQGGRHDRAARPARRAPPGCRWPGRRGRPARPWRGRSRGTRGPRHRGPARTRLARRASRHEGVGQVAVPAQERGRHLGGGRGLSRRPSARAVQELVGDPGERGGHDHERARVGLDEPTAWRTAAASASEAPPNFQTCRGSVRFMASLGRPVSRGSGTRAGRGSSRGAVAAGDSGGPRMGRRRIRREPPGHDRGRIRGGRSLVKRQRDAPRDPVCTAGYRTAPSLQVSAFKPPGPGSRRPC